MHLGMHRMLLHAWRLEFAHPRGGELLRLEAPVDAAWQQVLARFDWTGALNC